MVLPRGFKGRGSDFRDSVLAGHDEVAPRPGPRRSEGRFGRAVDDDPGRLVEMRHPKRRPGRKSGVVGDHEGAAGQQHAATHVRRPGRYAP